MFAIYIKFAMSYSYWQDLLKVLYQQFASMNYELFPLRTLTCLQFRSFPDVSLDGAGL